MPAIPPHSIRTAPIDTAYIELDKLLKREDLAASGGEARYLVSQGMAWVNGAVEYRKRRKLVPGDRVKCGGIELQVVARSSGSDTASEPKPED